MPKPKEENLFVRLNELEHVHRELLESLRYTLESMQSYEEFASIRREKFDLLDQLKKETKEASRLVGRLKSKLPKQNMQLQKELKKIKTSKLIKTAPVKEAHKVSVNLPDQRTKKADKINDEIAKLTAELNDIESKLNSYPQ